MNISKLLLNSAVAAFLMIQPSHAEEDRLNSLFERLQTPDLQDWEQVEQAIWREWSQSGSKSMDLLLQRGRRAMSAGDNKTAIEHFTALTDHAPDFAEGWNARHRLFRGGEYGLSIADIGRALALNPRHFGAMQGLGRMLEELGEYEDALKAYSAAFAIHPHRPGLEEAIERLEAEVSGQDI